MAININVYSHEVGDELGLRAETSHGEMSAQSVPRIGEHFYIRVFPSTSKVNDLRMKVIRIEHTTTVINDKHSKTDINVIGVKF